MFSRVLKFNPNHDPTNGRFTSGPGGGMAKRLQQGRVDIRASEVESVMRDLEGSEEHPNLANLTIEGKAHFKGNSTLRREQMPQVPQVRRQHFIDNLPARVDREWVDPHTLKPTQNEIHAAKVARLYGKFRNGTAYPAEPILVSRDGYVLDGHHNFASKLLLRKTNGTQNIEIFRVNMSQSELLAAMRRYADKHDIPVSSFTASKMMKDLITSVRKYNPYHDPNNGQFTTGPGATNGGGQRGAVIGQASEANAARASRVQRLFDKFGVDKIVPQTNQPTKDPDELYKQADAAHAEMSFELRKLAKEMGMRDMTGTAPEAVPEAEFDKPGGMLFIAPLKGKARAKQKVDADYGGDWSRLMDVTRASVAVDDLGQVERVLGTIGAKFTLAKVPKNRFANPVSGYRDVLLNVRFRNGHVGEIQVHVKPMLKAKLFGGHHLYERQRNIWARYKPGAKVSQLKVSDRSVMKRVTLQAMSLYNRAWSKVKP